MNILEIYIVSTNIFKTFFNCLLDCGINSVIVVYSVVVYNLVLELFIYEHIRN